MYLLSNGVDVGDLDSSIPFAPGSYLPRLYANANHSAAFPNLLFLGVYLLIIFPYWLEGNHSLLIGYIHCA